MDSAPVKLVLKLLKGPASKTSPRAKATSPKLSPNRNSTYRFFRDVACAVLVVGGGGKGIHRILLATVASCLYLQGSLGALFYRATKGGTPMGGGGGPLSDQLNASHQSTPGSKSLRSDY